MFRTYAMKSNVGGSLMKLLTRRPEIAVGALVLFGIVVLVAFALWTH